MAGNSIFKFFLPKDRIFFTLFENRYGFRLFPLLLLLPMIMLMTEPDNTGADDNQVHAHGRQQHSIVQGYLDER